MYHFLNDFKILRMKKQKKMKNHLKNTSKIIKENF